MIRSRAWDEPSNLFVSCQKEAITGHVDRGDTCRWEKESRSTQKREHRPTRVDTNYLSLFLSLSFSRSRLFLTLPPFDSRVESCPPYAAKEEIDKETHRVSVILLLAHRFTNTRKLRLVSYFLYTRRHRQRARKRGAQRTHARSTERTITGKHITRFTRLPFTREDDDSLYSTLLSLRVGELKGEGRDGGRKRNK